MLKNNKLYKYINNVLYKEKKEHLINNNDNLTENKEENVSEKNIEDLYDINEISEYIIIKRKDSLKTEQSIIENIEHSETISLSSNDEELRFLENNRKFIKGSMCNKCNKDLKEKNKYKCIKIKNINNKDKYYCLSCGFKKKETLKNKLNMNLIYVKNKED